MYDVIVDEFGVFGNGVVGGEDDGIGVIVNGVGDGVLFVDFDCFVYC